MDSPAFRIAAPAALSNVLVPGKSEIKVSVVFEPDEQQIAAALAGDCVVPAKLFVTCTSRPLVPSWVYYLRGRVLFEQPTAPAKGGGKKK
ncbi:hypothetical protein EON65_49495 [archaeon]|nr:MAG: hypothetical protein EON65_49495 [archaeon]